MKKLQFAAAITLMVAAFLAPNFVGVCRQFTFWSDGQVAIRFSYIVPLADYGVKDAWSIFLAVLYVWVPFGIGFWLACMSFDD